MNVDINRVLALREAFNTIKKRHRRKVLPKLDDRKKRLRETREKSVGDKELLESAIENLESNGIRVHFAPSRGEALSKIIEEVGSEKLVVKSKSNVTKEIELCSELEKRGIDTVETDIGDRIAQLTGSNPSHPTGPVAHLSAKEIASALKKKRGVEVGDSPEEIVSYIRGDIVESFEKSRVGITGANAVTAEEGSILLAHNEGNIFRTMRNDKHIVVTGIDKVYPTIEDALNMIKILSYHATGEFMPSFLETITGVSKTADVEKKFFPGIHKPREIVVVLLDNGRSGVAEGDFRELLYCIGCGNCLVYCPMYNAVGSEYASHSHLGGRGLAYSSTITEQREKKLDLCLSCGKCRKNCPVEINVPWIIRNLRSNNKLSEEARYFVSSHKIWLYYNYQIMKNSR